MGLGERAFKKAIHTREYRERAQPENRKRLGLLEKHKDYVLRARDYHRKQNALKALRIRAANRNPDEFHFGMIKSRIINGKHSQNHTEKNFSIPADMLKLMKTQDVSYISLQKNSNKRKLQQAEEELAVAQAISQGQTVRSHIFFAEDNEEKEDLLSELKANATLVKEPLKSKDYPKDTDNNQPMIKDMLSELEEDPTVKHIRKKQNIVKARRMRVEQLEKLEHKLCLDRQLLGKGKRKKIGVDQYGFAKFKWDAERKK